jgi:hypothetical protein
MILNTYDKWYSDQSVKWNVEDFLYAVVDEELCNNLGMYLEENRINQITLTTLPELDLGEKPPTFNPRNKEGD